MSYIEARNQLTGKFFEDYEMTVGRDEVLTRFEAEIGNLENHGYRIARAANLISLVNSSSRTDAEGYRLALKMKTVALLEIESQDPANSQLHDRVVLLLENDFGKKAFVTVVLHGRAPGKSPRPGEAYDLILHGPAHFGGAGIYPVEFGTDSPMADALHHSEGLATTMTEKGWYCGVNGVLSGTKVIITGDAWKNTPEFQFVTGLMFSKRGPFPYIITGSDAGQTPKTIALMERGSRVGGGVGQIVGTENGIPDTANYVRYSMQATYQELSKLYPEQIVNIATATVAVQGVGKIGSSTALMFLEAGSPLICVTDVYKPQIEAFLRGPARKYSDRIKVVHPDEIWDTGALVFSPCSSHEHIISYDKVDRLAQAGTKLILSGANNPLEDTGVAEYAHGQGILMPPDPLSNNGSATSAALEAQYIAGHKARKYPNAQKFVEQVLIPHIDTNFSIRVPQIAALSSQQRISLYQAGHQAYLISQASA